MRRPNGTGTIVKLSGNRRKPYVVRIPAKDKRGRVIQMALSYHATGTEAQAALDAYNAAKVQGKAPASDMLDYTVQQVYEAWSGREYKKLEEKGRKASMQSHKAAWNKRISRYADRKMRSVSLDEWQSILDEDEDNGLSQSTINNDAILIRNLYAYSMERDIVGKDYSQFLDIPSVDLKNPKGAFNDLQIKQLEDMAATGIPWADTVLMLCYTGFRITEFLTLTKFSYDAEGDYFRCGIKTTAGKERIVPVHPKIKHYLLRWISKDGDAIICNDSGGAVPAWEYRAKIFHPIMEALGMPQATPHWCRHTFATRLHAVGVPDLELKRLIGHSTGGDVTERYTHTSLEQLAAAIRLLA